MTTAKAAAKVARGAKVVGATRTMATMATTAATAATMTPNGDKENEDGIWRRQQCRDIIHRSKRAGKCNRQLISRGGTSRTSFPFVGVVAGLTSPVGIGKDGGHDGWLCWGWRGGVADHWGTKNEKKKGQKSCLWTGLIHSGGGQYKIRGMTKNV